VAYIFSIITVWIVVAVLFGFAIGWLARGRARGGGGRGGTGGGRSRRKGKKVKFR
jgi:hypothetical protein